MRLLLDSCIWGPVRDELRAAGHDVDWVGDWPSDPGDEVILSRAHAEGRIFVTRDKDFGVLVFVNRLPHAGVIRLARVPNRKQADLCLLVLELYGADLTAGAFVTADLRRVRIRRSTGADR
jgi:predicted nuclease of predicted toxin-antitoxin system